MYILHVDITEEEDQRWLFELLNHLAKDLRNGGCLIELTNFPQVTPREATCYGSQLI